MTSWLSRLGMLRTLASRVRLAIRLMREPRIPRFTKMLPVLAVLYVISPFDFVPDVLPLIGQLDDLGLIVVTLEVFLRLCPPGALEFHRAAIAEGRAYAPMSATDTFIDAEYRRE